MNTNIFDRQTNQNLLERFEKINANTPSLWGKMNPAQMVLHCQKPLDVAEGKLMIKGGLLGFFFGKLAKNNFINNKRIAKNSPTAPEFKIAFTPDFETEKSILTRTIHKFGTLGATAITNKKHPFFGEMTDEEWGILQFVHLDHHLKQFGA